MTPAEFIAKCRRLGACEEGIARFKRRRGTVDQRLALRDERCSPLFGDEVRATIEELERLRVAADAMEAELDAARTYLRERCGFNPPCDLCRCKAQALKHMDKLRRPR